LLLELKKKGKISTKSVSSINQKVKEQDIKNLKKAKKRKAKIK
jgi:hypothetical protein